MLPGGILFLLVGSQFNPHAPGVIAIEHFGKQYVTFINTADLPLLILVTKKHLYAMQVCPRLFDYERNAGILVNLHCICLSTDDDLERLGACRPRERVVRVQDTIEREVVRDQELGVEFA